MTLPLLFPFVASVDHTDLIISLLKWVLICAARLDLTHFFFILPTLKVKSDFITRISGTLPSMFMIMNSREFLSVLHVVFLNISLVLSFLTLWFVIKHWIVLLPAFYILILLIRLAFGILFKKSFTFASKMDYFNKSFVSRIFFQLPALYGKVSVFLLNWSYLEIYCPRLVFY